MLEDVVVDSNIFGHAQNPELNALFREATDFLEQLVVTPTEICFDLPGSGAESRILKEYRTVVAPSGLAAPVLIKLLTERRFREVESKVPRPIRRIVNNLIVKEKATDKVFLCTAFNSVDSVLVSHDDED